MVCTSQRIAPPRHNTLQARGEGWEPLELLENLQESALFGHKVGPDFLEKHYLFSDSPPDLSSSALTKS